MKTLGITLFEDQLVRSYLTGDSGDFFRKLLNRYRIVVFTNSQLITLIESKLLEFQLRGVLVYEFKSVPYSKIARFFSFLFRWCVQSESVIVKSRKDGFLRAVPRTLVNKLSKSFRLTSTLPILRTYFQHTLDLQKITPAFCPSMPLLDYLFATSLTNNYEDIPVSMAYRSVGTQLIGTVRSWDNLSTHGALHVAPDVFLSHSPWIDKAAKDYQNLKESKTIDWMTPCYDNAFLKPRSFSRYPKSPSNTKILYASMGLATNPDDLNFMNWLVDFWSTLPDSYTLSILQHPKFIVDPKLDDARVSIHRFDYSSSSLFDYFSFLSQYDLVICGGTSVALDSMFARVPVIFVNFEILPQAFWKSGLRYFDFMKHTVQLVKEAQFPTVKSPDELRALLLKREFTLASEFAREFMCGPHDTATSKYFLSELDAKLNHN